MRILYFAQHEPWPLTTGARLRNFHLARALGKRCEVTYVGISSDPGQQGILPPAGTFERTLVLKRDRSYTASKLIRGIIGPTSIPALNLWSAEAAAQLKKLVEEGGFDTVQLETVQLMPYLRTIHQVPSRPAVVSDWHNIESELMWRYAEHAGGPRKWVAKRTARLLEDAERRLLRECEVCTIASERERQNIASENGRLRVIPNGVDVEYYAGTAARSFSALRQGHRAGPGYVVFVGSMDYHANIDAVLWFAAEVWPEIARRDPSLIFRIVGRNPPPGIQALASPQIEVTGTVEDVRPFYDGACAVVAPLRIGSGTRLKILESMAAGVPVISTRVGAEGLDVIDHEHALMADTAAQFVNALGDLMASPDMALRLATSAHDLVRTRYDWSVIGAELYDAHCQAAEQLLLLKAAPSGNRARSAY